MVLQNKYKRAASARYAQSSTAGAASSAPSPRPRPPKPNRSPSPPTGSSELPDGEDSLGDGPPRSFRRRELGTNAGRYEEVEVEETESDVEAENEVREEEDRELSAFSEKQRGVEVASSVPLEDPLDMDVSFAHLLGDRHGKGRPRTLASLPANVHEVAQARELHRESDRVSSTRELSKRFTIPSRSTQLPPTPPLHEDADVDNLLADIAAVDVVGDAVRVVEFNKRVHARTARGEDDLDRFLQF